MIQIQHLLKLNNHARIFHHQLYYSNTTFVKVKLEFIGPGLEEISLFKYNIC